MDKQKARAVPINIDLVPSDRSPREPILGDTTVLAQRDVAFGSIRATAAPQDSYDAGGTCPSHRPRFAITEGRDLTDQAGRQIECLDLRAYRGWAQRDAAREDKRSAIA